MFHRADFTEMARRPLEVNEVDMSSPLSVVAWCNLLQDDSAKLILAHQKVAKDNI